MKRSDVVTLLAKINENTVSLYRYAKEDGDEEQAEAMLRESITLDMVLWILTDDKKARKYWDIYFKEGN